MVETQAVSITMRTSLPGLVNSICDQLNNTSRKADRRPDLAFVLREVLNNLQATIDGKHTIKEFADYYCMSTQGENAGENEVV